MVPLCRRCHRTLHDWDIGTFSPDTTEKALEVENKRREIRGLPIMKMEEVTHSDYWYRKHNVARPKVAAGKKHEKIAFKIPSTPLCGEQWVSDHLGDYTPGDIESLTIEVSFDNQQLAVASLGNKKGALTAIMRENSNT